MQLHRTVPLASGRLTRDWDADTKRSKTDVVAHAKYDSTEEQDKMIVDRVGEVADKMGISRTQVALAWLLQKEQVTAPIIGATKTDHLADSVAAVDVELNDEDIKYIEEPYQPHKFIGALKKTDNDYTR